MWKRSWIGAEGSQARSFANSAGVIAMTIVILVIGIVVDAVFFGTVERWTRRRWGLEDTLGA